MDSTSILLGGALTVVLAALLVIQRKRVMFWAAFLLVFVPIDYIKRFYFEVPAILRWLPVLAIVGFALVAFLLMPHVRARIPQVIKGFWWALLILAVLGMMANEKSSFGQLVVSQRGYIMLFGFMTIMKMVFEYYDKDQLFSFLLLAGMASTCVAVLQRLIYVVILDYTGDRVTGLFSVDGIFVFYQLFCICTAIVYWIYGRRIMPWFTNEQVLLVLLTSVIVCNDKAALIFLALLIVFVSFNVGFQQFWKSFGKIAGGFALFAVVGIVFTAVYNSGYEGSATEELSVVDYIENPENMRKYIFGGDHMYQKFTPAGQLLRGAAVEFAWKQIEKDPVTFWVGLGPSSTQHSNMPGAMGWVEEKFPGFTIGRVPLSMHLGEAGMLGVILNLAFLIAFYSWKPKDPAAEEPGYHLIRKAFVVLSIMYWIYENLYFEPMYMLVIAVMVYPNPLGVQRKRRAAAELRYEQEQAARQARTDVQQPPVMSPS
ncbi:MAG: hypothetical protein SF053_18440 [Bacteroidia bacterium]|nr:hypothetical protein [Bacteroidia bacterium]